MRIVDVTLLAVLVASTAVSSGAYAADTVEAGCVPNPTHSPWPPGVDPGPPLAMPFLSAHRGGTNLAPQQTAEAYRSAIAFGTSVIEVDLRRLKDGTIVAFHDDAGPDGRALNQVTLDEFKAWNAATGSWAGTAFDPARYQTFAEVLAIAGRAGVGLDVEFKSWHPLGAPYREVATAVAAAGLMDTTIWQYYTDLDVPLISAIQSVDPDARFNYNLLGIETPRGLYNRAAGKDFSFGSNLAEFTAPRLSAIHDGCGIAVPHSYDEGADQEFAQIQSGRARGVDGFQTNQVDVAADALDRPVRSAWTRQDSTACLVNPDNGYGLIGRQVRRADGSSLTTGPGGCVATGGQKMTFAGDGAARASAEA